MNFNNNPMRFGLFMGPYHKPGLNPYLSLRRDIQTIVNLDELGYDEVWIGEHHSGGVETIGTPELMIAAAAERTKRIKLGTGVVSLPYHNPFMVADRIVQLDYMTGGRTMFGIGPGQLVQDATMIGLDPMTNRQRLQEAIDVILRLFKGETVTMKTDWFDLKDAYLQMRPFSNFDVATVSVISPSGPLLAGKYGMGLLSVAATNPVGVEKLLEHWQVIEEESAKHGHTPDRSKWRLMGPMHIAETLEQAKEDVKYGLSLLQDYLAHINPAPEIDWFDLDNVIDTLNDTGAAVIGTPEMARKQIDRLLEKSGGFGTYLLMGIDWASYPATARSHQLFAEEVIPYYNGTRAPLMKGFEDVMGTGYEGAKITAAAQSKFAESYKKQKG
ncbi:MAG: LLM class flavin-dependent oxidoreductase [Porticoccaceae bacterium]|nr:LLM class flavin-dependent oxidoreductase [Porticoccaceae bacterium]